MPENTTRKEYEMGHGASRLQVAKVITDTKVEYTLDTWKELPGLEEVNGTYDKKAETFYADNKAAKNLTTEGAPTRKFTLLGKLDPYYVAYLNNDYYNEATGVYIEKKATTQQLFAVRYITDLTDGDKVYSTWFACSLTNRSEETDKTRSDSIEKTQTVLEFTCLDPIHSWKLADDTTFNNRQLNIYQSKSNLNLESYWDELKDLMPDEADGVTETASE